MKFSLIKKRMVTFLATAIVIAIFISMFVGCGQSSNVSQEKTQAVTSSTEATAEAASKDGLPIVKEPLTLSIFISSRLASDLYTPDTYALKELTRITNIKFNIKTVFQRQAADQFKLMMASGDIPDIVCNSVTNMNKYGVMGAFLSLDELIGKYSPNIKKYLIDNKSAMAETAAPDGKIYAIPMLAAIKTSLGYCIRKDWLDKLSLQPPVTIDDWHTVLTKFKETDLNGNGKHDEVPLFLDKPWDTTYLTFADAWKLDLSPDQDYWAMGKDGVVFAPIQEECKQFLTTMAQWYGEGLIDKEFVTREDTTNYHILNNIGGATNYWTGYVAAQNSIQEVLAKDPKTNWQVIPPPVLKAGDPQKTFRQQTTVVSHSWAISAKNKHPVETMKLFDYVYSDKGALLFNFGIEGDTYTMTDGKPHYTDKVKKNPEGSSAFLKKNGLMALIGMRQMPEYEADICADEDTRKQMWNYIDNNNYFDPFPTLSLNEAEKDVYSSKMTAINTYVEEMLVKFMTGVEPMSKWDEYVKKVNDMGIETCAKLKNQSLARYKEILNK